MSADRRFKAHPNLGALIHNNRKARGLTLAELAAKVGSTKSYLCEVERGVSPSPGFVFMCLLSDALRIPMAHLKAAALAAQALDGKAMP